MSEKRTFVHVLGALSIALLAAAGPALGQEEAAGAPGELPPGMTPEMMAAWEKAATPGPEHEMLAEMAGSWKFTGTFWMGGPDGPAETTAGTSERTLILGGRVLVEKVESEMMGQAFEGMGLTGFDNVSGEYWGTWNDNMGTGVMLSTGTCAEDGSCEFTGTWNDPLVDGPKTVRMTMKVEEGSEVYAMYDKAPDGTEFKAMELVYTRSE